MIDFSHTITTGEIVVSVSALCTAASFLFRKGGSTARLEMAVERALEEITELKKEISQVGLILTQVAVQNERMDNMARRQNMIDQQMSDMRRGQGFIQAPRPMGVDGEY